MKEENDEINIFMNRGEVVVMRNGIQISKIVSAID